jgi:hypothetical protein
VTSVLDPYDAIRYCAEQHWIVVGHQFRLLVRPGETIMVAVLARDQRGHFLAVSPVDLDGKPGVGIIDLNTAEARFAQFAASGSRLPN